MSSIDLSRRLEPESIGEALYLLRRRTPLTREQLADKANVVLATYTRYERDTTRNGVYDVVLLRRVLRELARELDVEDRALWDAVFEALDKAEGVRFSAQAEAGGVNHPKTKRERKPA